MAYGTTENPGFNPGNNIIALSLDNRIIASNVEHQNALERPRTREKIKGEG